MTFFQEKEVIIYSSFFIIGTLNLIKFESESHSAVPDSLQPHGLYILARILQARVGSLSLLQGIFPTQGSNPGLPYCRWILYQPSHQGSPKILEWVAYPFSSRCSWSRNQTGVSCIAGKFFTSWATRETLSYPATDLNKVSWECMW